MMVHLCTKSNKLFQRLCILAVALGCLTASAQNFAHPGMINGKEDLDRAREGVRLRIEPWRSAFERLQHSQFPGVNGIYTPSPVATVTDNGSRSPAILADSEAAYVNAVEWYITRDHKYADTAINILDAWATICTLINGSNAELAANIDFFDMVNAAEIIRHSQAGWSETNIATFTSFLNNVIYPVVSPSNYDSFGAGSNLMMMMIGVFNDNPSVYKQGYENFTGSNSAVACFACLYDTNPASFGQSVDDWRDQGHPQLGVSIGVAAAELELNATGRHTLAILGKNVLLAAVEYSAKYNLGYAVPWDDTFGTTPTHISSGSRGRFWPFYAMAKAVAERSHQKTEPYTNQVVEAEGIESLIDQGGGIGTLLYTQRPTERAPSPQYALLSNEGPGGWLMAGNNGAAPITATSPAFRILETFREVILPDGYSAIQSEANHHFVTVNGTSPLIASSPTITGNEQKFKIIDMGNMQYELVSTVNGETIQVNADGTLTPGMGGSDNEFNVYNIGTTIPPVVTSLNGNTYKLINVASGLAMDVAGASTSAGAAVDQADYTGGSNQLWIFTNTGNGFYNIQNTNSGLLVDVSGNSISGGALIDQWNSDGGLNQQWVVQFANYAENSGPYNILTAHAPGALNVLEVPGSSLIAGIQLDQWTENAGGNQYWYILTP